MMDLKNTMLDNMKEADHSKRLSSTTGYPFCSVYLCHAMIF